jgi:hypothetical protein
VQDIASELSKSEAKRMMLFTRAVDPEFIESRSGRGSGSSISSESGYGSRVVMTKN